MTLVALFPSCVYSLQFASIIYISLLPDLPKTGNHQISDRDKDENWLRVLFAYFEAYFQMTRSMGQSGKPSGIAQDHSRQQEEQHFSDKGDSDEQGRFE
jgi:hypothetical protein